MSNAPIPTAGNRSSQVRAIRYERKAANKYHACLECGLEWDSTTKARKCCKSTEKY